MNKLREPLLKVTRNGKDNNNVSWEEKSKLTMYRKQELSKLEARDHTGNYYEGPGVGHKDLLSIAVGGRKIQK